MVTQTNFEKFEAMYHNYSTCSQGLNQLGRSSGIPNNLRNLAEGVVQNDFPEDNDGQVETKQAVILDVHQTRNPGKVNEVLKYGNVSRKQEANEYASYPGRLERILKKTPEGYVDTVLKLGLVKPRESYSGTGSGAYAQIAELQKDFEEIVKKTPEEIPEMISTQFASEYDEAVPKEKATLELVSALRQIDGTLDQLKYQTMVHKRQEKFSEALKGKESGYLAANLEGKDFVDFYEDSKEAIKQYQIQAERQAQRTQRPVA